MSQPALFQRLQEEIELRERTEGISPLDLLDLPPALQHVLTQITRAGQISLTDLATDLALPEEEVLVLTARLVEKGYLREYMRAGERYCRTHFGRKRERELPLDLWEALSERTK